MSAAGSLYGWSGLSLALTDRFLPGAAGVREVFSAAISAFTGAVLLYARMPVRLRGLGAGVIAAGCGACATVLAALAGLLLFSGAGAVLACLVLLAAGYGTVASGMPVLTRTLLRPGEFGQVFPIVLTGWGAAGFLAPQLSGQVRDATGSFDAVIISCLVTSGLAMAAARAFGTRHRRT